MTDQIQKEIEKTVNMLPQTIPDYAFEKVTLDESFDKNFIVYKSAYVPVIENYSEIKNRRMAECHCTSCDTTFYAEQISAAGCHGNPIGFVHPDGGSVIYSYDVLTCPYCNETVKAIHTSVIGKYTYHVSDAYCATVHNINGHLAVLTWVVEKKLDRSGDLTYISRRGEGIVIIKNNAFRVTGCMRTMNGSWSYLNRWELRKRFDEKIGEVDKEFIFLNDTEALYKTDSANCALPEYINGSDNPLIGAYMRIWSKYPNVENLVKQGYIDLLNEALSKCYSYSYSQPATFSISLIKKYLNLKRAKPLEILGIDKSELNLTEELDLEQLRLYRTIKTNSGVRLDTDLLKAVANKFGIAQLQTFFEHKKINGYKPPAVKTINYLIKQRNFSAYISTQYLIDYWDMLQMLYDTMPTEMLYPKNLVTEHNKVTDLIKAKENQIIDKKIKEIAAESSYLSFKDDELGLFIRPAATHKEFINEGKQLHHCVSTYARSVAEGKTLILFIRKVSEPDKSYFTLEYRNEVVQQNRGLRNCERTDDIILFEQHWLNYLKKNKRKRVGICQK